MRHGDRVHLHRGGDKDPARIKKAAVGGEADATEDGIVEGRPHGIGGKPHGGSQLGGAHHPFRGNGRGPATGRRQAADGRTALIREVKTTAKPGDVPREDLGARAAGSRPPRKGEGGIPVIGRGIERIIAIYRLGEMVTRALVHPPGDGAAAAAGKPGAGVVEGQETVVVMATGPL